MWSKDGAVGNS